MWNLKKLNSQKQSRLVVPRDKEVRGGLMYSTATILNSTLLFI